MEALDSGADDYITKPFKTRELISRIHSVLRRTKKEEQNIIKIQDITIHLKEAKVFKKDKPVFLTALEYKILLILCMQPSKVFTRESILANIWDTEEEYVNDNTLTVYIKRIREKIEDDMTNPKIILTVRGLGYQVNNEK
ncbi:MAG TPA: response regulator transcription factor [Candidatus Caccenecus avistercoris]|nr:response regulator transcription factor [Candidatus Caccenecus avistercoris]